MVVVIDTDAVLCLRHLGLLPAFLGAPAFERRMGQFAARHELSDIQAEVERWEARGELEVVALSARDKTLRQLKQVVDKGEAEALAWMTAHGEDGDLFISNDKLARQTAYKHGLAAGDAFELLVRMVVSGVLSRAALREATAVWEDPRRSFCRPADYDGFDGTYDRRVEGLL